MDAASLSTMGRARRLWAVFINCGSACHFCGGKKRVGFTSVAGFTLFYGLLFSQRKSDAAEW